MSDERVMEFVARNRADCPHCGYALGGLLEAACPECGRRLTMASLLGPRHRPVAWWMWLVMGALVAANAYMVWRLWYHPTAANPWEALFVRMNLGRRSMWFHPGGFGLLPVINAGVLIYAWRFDESVGLGAKRWHVLAVGGALTALYVGVGLTM